MQNNLADLNNKTSRLSDDEITQIATTAAKTERPLSAGIQAESAAKHAGYV